MSTIGIAWDDDSQPPQSDRKWLRGALTGWTTRDQKVADLPTYLGPFCLPVIARGVKRRPLYLHSTMKQVGVLIDDPNPDTGLPSDGSHSSLDYVEPVRGKPKLEIKEHPGFGWDPYGED